MTEPLQNHGFPPNAYNPHCWITGKPEIGEGTWILAGAYVGRGCRLGI